MEWKFVALVLAACAASFFLVPHQIMLATSNRIGVRFERFRGKFHFAASPRVAVAITGAAAVLALGHVAAPLWSAVLFGLVVGALYLLDFYQVERIGRKFSEPR